MKVWLKSYTLIIDRPARYTGDYECGHYIDTYILGHILQEGDRFEIWSISEEADCLVKGATLSFLEALKERGMLLGEIR